jgi:hypothetical protein
MAYGFQNTCDSDEYFYLDNVPGYVLVNEFYYIVTQEGDIFCGKYVNIPAVDYQIQTYNLVGMTAQTNAALCNNINPCPDFFIPTSQIVSTTQVNKCACLTEYPLGASCVVPNVTPQNPNVTVNLKITGGTAPYSIYSANTETLITNVTTNGGTSNILVLRPSGTYCFDIYDFYQTKISHCCTVNSASTLLTATYLPTNTNQCYNSGSVAVTINGGTPPYTVYRNGVSQGQTTNFGNLGVGANTFYVTDSSTPMQQTPQSSQNITTTTITYPLTICMTVSICNQQFNLTFNRSSTSICPPTYFCDNPGDIGTGNLILTGNTTTLEWGTIPTTIETSSLNLPGNCNISTNTLSFTKVQNTQQPAGSYNIQGAFAGGTSSVTTGACLITPTFTYSVVGTCSGLYQGSIIIVPNITPFTPTFNGTTYPTNQTVFSNLGAGNYTLFITSNGTPSSTQIITVPSSVGTSSTRQICVTDYNYTTPLPSYTLRSNVVYGNIPDGVTVYADFRRGYYVLLGYIQNQSDLSNYTFTEMYTRIYKNGTLLHDITNDIGSPTVYPNPQYFTENCWNGYSQGNSYQPTDLYPITINNNDEFTFENRFVMNFDTSANIYSQQSQSCYESISVQSSNVLVNVTDNSSSCFTFTNPTPISQNLEIKYFNYTQERQVVWNISYSCIN